MGAVCCCPSQEDFEEYTSYPNGCIYQHCLCLKCCVRWFLRMDIILKTPKYPHNVDTIFILAVFMNGWKEAKTVQSVIRRWCLVKIHELAMSTPDSDPVLRVSS